MTRFGGLEATEGPSTPFMGSAVAFLPAALASRVRSAESRIHIAASWEEAESSAIGAGGGVLITDPTANAGGVGRALAELCTQVTTVIPVIYAPLAPDLVEHLRNLSRFDLSDVVLLGYDDTPRRFAELADLAQSASLTSCVLTRLDRLLAKAPQLLRRAIRDLFQAPQRYHSVDELAAAASMPRRTLYRQIAQLNLSSPRVIIATSRVVRALGLLRDPRRKASEVSRHLGYSRAEALAEHIAFVTGLRVRDARSGATDAIAQRIVARLVAGSSDGIDTLPARNADTRSIRREYVTGAGSGRQAGGPAHSDNL